MNASKVIGVGGYLRSGKDTFADHLVKEHGYTKLFMSDPLNEALMTLNPWVYVPDVYRFGWKKSEGRTIAFQHEFERYQTIVNEMGYTDAKRLADVRGLLQRMGTEVGRNMIDKELWVKLASKNIAAHLLEGKRVVVTGMRFPNELDMIRSLGGTNVWIHREEALAGDKSHASESSVEEGDFDQIVTNTSTLESFYGVVDNYMYYMDGGR